MPNHKKQLAKLTSITAAACLLISGCEILVKNDIKKFAEAQTSECSGKIGEIAVVKGSEGADNYQSVAEVTIDNESYELKMDVKTGPGGTIIEADNSPCLEHKLKKGIQSIFQ